MGVQGHAVVAAGQLRFLQRNALLHLVHPDTFESMVSPQHRELIVKVFAEMFEPGTVDVDANGRDPPTYDLRALRPDHQIRTSDAKVTVVDLHNLHDRAKRFVVGVSLRI